MCQANSNTPPCPLDDESITNPLECPPLRWGLIGCGRVSHDFTQALKLIPTAKVVACSARSIESAKTFADKHNIPTYCKSSYLLVSFYFYIHFFVFFFSLTYIYFFLIFETDGSYDDLLKNEDVDIVYVGNVHAFRRSVGEKVLLANKHCLLEKPFTCNLEDAKYLIQLAKERNLFLLEVRTIYIRIYILPLTQYWITHAV